MQELTMNEIEQVNGGHPDSFFALGKMIAEMLGWQ